MKIKFLVISIVAIAVFFSGASFIYAHSFILPDEPVVDITEVNICDSKNPKSWRDAQTIEGIFIEEDPSCSPDMPATVVAATKGTNNVSIETLNASGLASDAVTKENDKDGDGDPDVIHIRLEIISLNEGIDPLVIYDIAPGIRPAFWAFAPKATGMVVEGMSAAHLMRMPSPSIRVEQGDEVFVTIENTHFLPHTAHFHGVDHPFLTSSGEGNDGVPQTSEKPIMPGESRTYQINARTTGTMAYHCHVQPDVHILMGLNGMFIIEENRPNNLVQTFNIGAGKVRHRSVSSYEKFDGEFDLHYQDVDKELHMLTQGTDDPRKVSRLLNNKYNATERTPEYFLFNGKSFPYTLRDSQVIVDPDSKYRLRIFNIGAESVALHTHGHKILVEALDGVDLPSGTEYYRDVVDIHAAQRVDAVLETTNDGLNSYGPGVWPFHDHHEAHITTDGISPGGGISMIVYRSFLGENGVPKVQGVDLRQFFIPGYYAGVVDIWETYDKDNFFSRRGVGSRSMVIVWIVIVFVVALFVGYIIGVGLYKKKDLFKRIIFKNAKNQRSKGFVFAHTLFISAIVLSMIIFSVLMQNGTSMNVSAQALSNASMKGIEGIHIMFDGSIMLGTGKVLDDARISEDGNIILGSGETVTPVMDLREGGSIEDIDMSIDERSINVSSIESIGVEGMKGIHIMPSGRVMTGIGIWVDDAVITEKGNIILGSGEEVVPILDMRSGAGIRRTENTMVVNENFDKLPPGCMQISGEKTIVVTGGVEAAKDFPGTIFTYDMHSIEDIDSCTKLTVTFVNKDKVRHQFMVHDLPTEIYPMGMFNIEVNGPGEETGTFITPADKKTLFVHCGVSGHEAKGMVSQIKNAGGTGNLPNIPGITRSITDTAGINLLAIWGFVGIIFGIALFVFVKKLL